MKAARRLPDLPRITDLAARVRDGEDLHHVATQYGVSHKVLLARFSQAGFAPTGYPMREQKRRDLRETLKQVRESRTDESWMADGACRSVGTDTFYPEPNDNWRRVRAICLDTCPVIGQCREWVMRRELGLGYKLRYGVHAGMSPLDRVKYEPQWLAEQESAA